MAGGAVCVAVGVSVGGTSVGVADGRAVSTVSVGATVDSGDGAGTV